MYYPGSNRRISLELQRKRKEKAEAENAARLGRIRNALIGATIHDVEMDTDSLAIMYTKVDAGHSASDCFVCSYGRRIVIKGTDFGLYIDNDEKEW